MNKPNNFKTASLNIDKVVAGSKIDCLLTFTVGQHGIAKGGSIKVLFRAISDAGIPQFVHSNRPNFVKFHTTNKNVELIAENSTTGLVHRLHERPWWNGFILNIGKPGLSPEDKITISFRNWQQQTFVENMFLLKLFSDPFGTGRFFAVPKSPHLAIIPDVPHHLKLTATSTPAIKGKLKISAGIMDRWDNPCTQTNTTLLLQLPSNKHQSLKINRGFGKITIPTPSQNIFTITTHWNRKNWTSNPIESARNRLPKQFWADLHWQSEEMFGAHELSKGFKFATTFGALDITSHQGNDFQITKRFWNSIVKQSHHHTIKDKFVAFPGFEWSGNPSVGGDHNIIFNQSPILSRSSHALLSNSSDIPSDSPNILDLFRSLNSQDTLVIAHSGGRRANLTHHSHNFPTHVEVHSCWGTDENLLFEALERDLTVGIVSNSDGHTLRPGAETPGNSLMFKDISGLTCVIANTLSPQSIFQALKNRHCFATTGHRPIFSVSLQNKNHLIGSMGEVIDSPLNINHLQLNISFTGTTHIKIIQVFNKSKCIHIVRPQNTKVFTHTLSLQLKPRQTHAIFVKVIQQDKHVAWSSPIFIKVKQ